MDTTSFDLETNEPLPTAIPASEPPPAWEQVANGRYRPRRIKGSYIGRELG